MSMRCPQVVCRFALATSLLCMASSALAVTFVGVPGTGTGPNGNTFAFEDPTIWDPDEGAGEVAPPGPDNIWFAENNTEDVVVVLSDPRSGGSALGDYNTDNVTNTADYTIWRDNSGSGASLPNDNNLPTPIGADHYDLWKGNFGAEVSLMMGTFAFGGEAEDGTAGDLNKKFTLVLNNSVTLTGTETPGGPLDERQIRIGRANFNPVGAVSGGTTEDFAWAILLHQAGTLQYEGSITSGARMDMSRDKVNSAGALYEISGDAVLNLAGAVRFGDRDNIGNRTTPGGIFRVRGSDASITVDDFINDSRLGLWDHDNIMDSDNPAGITRINLGKFVTEFVLDADGALKIVVNDELRLGRTEDTAGLFQGEQGYAFLRLKLSEPTTAGSGSLGSGDEIVLFEADRLRSSIDVGDPESEIEMGRFFDPDRAGLNSSGTTMLPHAGLWDGGLVTADYAGALYQWTINYADSSPDDGVLDDVVVLTDLNITGTPGDLSGNGTLDPTDRQILVDAIAAPPSIAIATAQNLFDLNADELVDNLDLALFDAHFPISASLFASQIPEPSSVALILVASSGLIALRVRRS